MRVLFKKGETPGGMHAHGFIEVPDGQEASGGETVYSRQPYLSIRMSCRDIEFGTSTELNQFDFDPSDAKSKPTKTGRSISTTGRIQPSPYSSYSLSLLGSSKRHDTVDITFRESEEENAWFGGFSEVNDAGRKLSETFMLEISLKREQFDQLIADLYHDGAKLTVVARADTFPKFYTTWSDVVDDGRLIKYLESEYDVENKNQILKGFIDGTDIEGFQRYGSSGRLHSPIVYGVHYSLEKSIEDTQVHTEPTSLHAPAVQPKTKNETKKSYPTSRTQIWINVLFAIFIAIALMI